MSTTAAIPETEHKDILKWWADGESSRKIAELLKPRGIDVGHATVWRLIQRIGMGNGDFDTAAAVTRLRGHAEDDVDKLFDIENQIIQAAHPGAAKFDYQMTMQGLKLLVAGHRLLLNRLRAQGLFGKTGDTIHRNHSHLWSEEEDGMGPYDEPVNETPVAVSKPRQPAQPKQPKQPEVFHVKQEKPLESVEIRRNTPAPVSPEPLQAGAANSPAPARTRPCPCGSGLKYKRCCAKAGPAVETQMRKCA